MFKNMKTTICTFCAQTGMLCKDCQSKLDSGEIDQIDIEIAKTATEFEKNNPNASKVEILTTIKRDDFVILIVKPGDLKYLTGIPLDFDKLLERKLKKPVKIIEKTKNKKKLLEEIFAPALISGINTVFVPLRSPKPGQSSVDEETVVVLAQEEKDKLPASLKEIRKIVKMLLEEDIRIVFR